MPEPHDTGDRTPAQRQADHDSLARLAETLVPALVAKLTGTGLGELEVREGDWKVRVRRPVGTVGHATTPRRADRPRLGGMSEARAPRPPATTQPAPEPDPRRAVVTSPAVGTFRPGVGVGSHVRAGDRIAVVDLLGIPQDVTAPIDGTLVEVFVQPGEAVEYGEEIAVVEAPPPPEPTAPGASGTNGTEPGGEA